MKKMLMMALLLAMAAGSLKSEEAAAAAPVKAADPIKLKGLKGIGIGSMPGLIPSQVPLISQVLNEPEAVVFRYWLSEKISWEGQLAMDYSTQPGSTTQTANTTAFGIGTGFKWNFKRPTETTLAQLLVGLSYATLAQKGENGVTTTNGTFSIYVGPGFEAFMPFWRSLSVEGSVRLRISTTQIKSDQQGSAAQSSSAVGFAGDGFTPLTLAMHYYF